MFLEYISPRTCSLVTWPSVAQTSFDQFIDIGSCGQYKKLFYFILFRTLLLFFASAELGPR